MVDQYWREKEGDSESRKLPNNMAKITAPHTNPRYTLKSKAKFSGGGHIFSWVVKQSSFLCFV